MLRWTERAAADLMAIGEYIAADNPSAARAWVEKLRQRAVKASKVPHTGRSVRRARGSATPACPNRSHHTCALATTAEAARNRRPRSGWSPQGGRRERVPDQTRRRTTNRTWIAVRRHRGPQVLPRREVRTGDLERAGSASRPERGSTYDVTEAIDRDLYDVSSEMAYDVSEASTAARQSSRRPQLRE